MNITMELTQRNVHKLITSIARTSPIILLFLPTVFRRFLSNLKQSVVCFFRSYILRNICRYRSSTKEIGGRKLVICTLRQKLVICNCVLHTRRITDHLQLRWDYSPTAKGGSQPEATP